MPRESRILTLSLPPKMAKEAEKIARAENRTRSELFREALRQYISQRRWENIRSWGEATAAKYKIKEKDIPKIIQSVR